MRRFCYSIRHHGSTGAGRSDASRRTARPDARSGLTMAIVAALLASVTLMGHRLHTEETVQQTKAADGWAFFQAKNNRSHMYAADAKLAELIGPAGRQRRQGMAPEGRRRKAGGRRRPRRERKARRGNARHRPPRDVLRRVGDLPGDRDRAVLDCAADGQSALLEDFLRRDGDRRGRRRDRIPALRPERPAVTSSLHSSLIASHRHFLTSSRPSRHVDHAREHIRYGRREVQRYAVTSSVEEPLRPGPHRHRRGRDSGVRRARARRGHAAARRRVHQAREDADRPDRVFDGGRRHRAHGRDEGGRAHRHPGAALFRGRVDARPRHRHGRRERPAARQRPHASIRRRST